MQGLRVDELLACLSAAPLSGTDLARLRDWIDTIHDSAECLALVEATAAACHVRIVPARVRTAPASPAACKVFAAWAAAAPSMRCRARREPGSASASAGYLISSACWNRAACATPPTLLACAAAPAFAGVIDAHRAPRASGRPPCPASSRPTKPPRIAEGSAQLDAVAWKARRRRPAARHQSRARLPAGGARCIGTTLYFRTGRGPVTAAQVCICSRCCPATAGYCGTTSTVATAKA